MNGIRAAALGCGLVLLAAGCSSHSANRPSRPSWPPGAYIGATWPRAVYVFLSSPRPEGDVRAAMASADEVIASAGRYLPTRDFSLLLPNPRDETLIANPTIRMLRLLAYARARSPAPVWLVGSEQDIDLVIHGRPSIPARAFAGFVLMPMTPDDCGGEAEMHEQGLDGMPTILVGVGSACAPHAPAGVAREGPAPITTPPFVAPESPPPSMALAPAAPPAAPQTPPAAPSQAAPSLAAPPTTASSAALPATPVPTPPASQPPAPSQSATAPALPPNMPFQKLPPARSGEPILKTAPESPVAIQPLQTPDFTPSVPHPTPPAPPFTPPVPPSPAADSIAT